MRQVLKVRHDRKHVEVLLQKPALSGDRAEAVQTNELQEHRPGMSPERTSLCKLLVSKYRRGGTYYTLQPILQIAFEVRKLSQN